MAVYLVLVIKMIGLVDVGTREAHKTLSCTAGDSTNLIWYVNVSKE